MESARSEGDERLLSPREVAERLGVSASGLRRLAVIYTRAGGELPRDPRSRSRLWPRRAVEELSFARSLVATRSAASIEEALVGLWRGQFEDSRGASFREPASPGASPRVAGLPGTSWEGSVGFASAPDRSTGKPSHFGALHRSTPGGGAQAHGLADLQAQGLADLHAEVVALRSAVTRMTGVLVDIREELVRTRLASSHLASSPATVSEGGDARQGISNEEHAELLRLRRRLRYLEAELSMREI